MTTDLFGRGIDIERVNIVINYDFPQESERAGEHASDAYLHRVGRAGRFGTKGLAISFVSSDEDEKALEEVQKRFEMHIPELPDKIDQKDYSTFGVAAPRAAVPRVCVCVCCACLCCACVANEASLPLLCLLAFPSCSEDGLERRVMEGGNGCEVLRIVSSISSLHTRAAARHGAQHR